MPLSDRWTRSQLRDLCRRELLDTSAKWFSDAELNDYISDWQSYVNDQFEFVWSTSSDFAFSTSTITISNIQSNVERLDGVYLWTSTQDIQRLLPKTINEMYALKRDWDQALPNKPTVVYSVDSNVFSVWPPPNGTYTGKLEYVVDPSFTGDGDQMVIPAWTKYSVKDYVGFRCYRRFGATQNLRKSMRYKRNFDMKLRKYRELWDGYFPKKAPKLIPVISNYEGRILDPVSKRGIQGYY